MTIKLKHIIFSLFAVGLFLVLVSALYHPEQSASPFLASTLTFLEKLGDALVIAALLGSVVERATREEHFRRFAQYLSVEVFGSSLPSGLREHIRGYFRMDLVRTAWEIDYTIQPWPEKAGYVQLHVASRYYMQNRSDTAKEYPFKYRVEDSIWPDTPTRITSVRAGNDTYEDEDLARLVRGLDGYQHFELAPPPVLDPHEGPRHPTYEFRTESIQGFREFVVSPFWALYPVMDTTFTVYYPHDFRVQFDTTFGDVGRPVPVHDKADKHLDGLKWKISTPILPGQGFFVRSTRQPPAAHGAPLKPAHRS